MRVKPVVLHLVSTLATVMMLSALGAAASPAAAQDKSPARKPAVAAKATASKTPAASAKKDAVKKDAAKKDEAKPKPVKAKKSVSSSEAVDLSRELLIKHGFQVTRVETVKDAQVIYYRAGNNGRGRGQGPLRKMIVRPYGHIVTFEAAPENVRLDIKLRLGF